MDRLIRAGLVCLALLLCGLFPSCSGFKNRVCGKECSADRDCLVGLVCRRGACTANIPFGGRCSQSCECAEAACGADFRCGGTPPAADGGVVTDGGPTAQDAGRPPGFNPADEVTVAEGFFQQGGCRDPQNRPRMTYLATFTIDSFEVTNGRYKECVTAGACTPPSRTGSFSRSGYYDTPGFEDYPVIFVTWDQARAYCAFRQRRLPTGAEWEKAARGASDARSFPWGSDAPSCALSNYAKDRANPSEALRYCVGDTLPVYDLAAGRSPYGAYNLSGNAGEWTDDSRAGLKVWRGGSFLRGDPQDDFNLRVSALFFADTPDINTNQIGFRCAAGGSPPDAGPPDVGALDGGQGLVCDGG